METKRHNLDMSSGLVLVAVLVLMLVAALLSTTVMENDSSVVGRSIINSRSIK